jgi:multiple sugar transport system permease protein
VALFLFPSLLGFSLFIVLPILMAGVFSLTNFSGGPRFKWIGIQNYIVLFKNGLFLQSLRITLVFTFWTVLLLIVLGLGFALLLNKPFLGRTFFRGLIFMPNVLSSIAVALAFMLILDPKRGPVNQLLARLGFDPPLWLSGQTSALPTIIVVTLWQNFGYYMVLFLGGLQTISPHLYEAAAIDGAGNLRRFVSITLPGLTPILFYSITIAVIRAFQVFDQVYIMTGGQSGGGPAGSTTVLVFEIYRSAFSQLRLGYAAAESVILLLLVFMVTIVQQRGQKKWVTYDIV